MQAVFTAHGQQFVLTGAGLTQDQFDDATDCVEGMLRNEWSPIDVKAQADFMRASGRYSGDAADVLSHALQFAEAGKGGTLSIRLP